MLDLIPPEELVPWRLPVADLLVGAVAAVIAFQILGRFTRRRSANVLTGGRRGRACFALGFAGLVVLLGRGLYGPPIRLLLTAPNDRPAQRFADRVARSPDLRAWYARRSAELRAGGETDEMLPRTLAYERSELRRNGFARLSDAQLKQRTEWLARALARAKGTWACGPILVGGEDDVARVLVSFDRVAGEAWYQLTFDAMVAEARNNPPARSVPPEDRARIVAELAPPPGRLGLARSSFYTPTESGSHLMRARCDREKDLYERVSRWDGPLRAAADLLLATADSYMTGDFRKEGESVEGVLN
jgi:hypothetical protein